MTRASDYASGVYGDPETAMKITDYIEALEKIRAEHGDDVFCMRDAGGYGVVFAKGPDYDERNNEAILY